MSIQTYAQPKRAPRHASYKNAIDWIARNDDTSCLDEEPSYPSVTMCLVADLFGRDTSEVEADIRRALKRQSKER